ncbi:hypothetical protein B0H14DRAFT_3872687 [Mycena olivaceomarginata]|nr:hypothetical protein B0H14DRAFT_3872687 [Mycena olivaceomarginata]
MSTILHSNQQEPPDVHRDTRVHSPIGAIELRRCTNDFIDTILGFLTAPFLQELIFAHECPYSGLAPTIIQFLGRSKCTLTSLSLRVPLDPEEVLAVPEPPCVREVVHLDIGCGEEEEDRVFTCSPSEATRAELEGSMVLAMIASRRPVLRELRIEGWRKYPVLSPAAVQALGADGLEAVYESECSSYCVRCSKPQQRAGASRNGVRTVLQNQTNMCTVLTPRSRHHLPPGIPQWIPNFDWTLSHVHSHHNPASWLFDNKMLIAIIKAGATPEKNNLLSMSCVNMPGPNGQYVVCRVPHIGCWGWYTYADGSLRVWNWKNDTDAPPVLCAWKEPTDPHWHFNQIISERLQSECEAAAIIVVRGIVIFTAREGA